MPNWKMHFVTWGSLALAGCASLDQASNSLSCILNPISSSCTPASGPAGGSAAVAGAPAADRFTKLQAVLDQEIELARAQQSDAVAAMQYLPIKLRSSAGPVQLLDTAITDRQSGQARSMRVLDSVSIAMPLAAKGRPEYTRAMNTLKSLANRLADNRGTASIIVRQAAADVQAQRVNTSTGTTKTPQGSPVVVEKMVDPQLPAGTEHYTIQAGAIRGQL